MKNYIKIVLSLVFFLIGVFYMNPVFAVGCISDKDCATSNCVAGQCFGNTISSPCLSNSACSSKNCYAGRCCPETYPMGGSCPKKSMAKEIPDIVNIDNSISGGTQTIDDPSKGEDTKDVEIKDTGMRFSGMTGQVEYLLPGKDSEDEDNWKLANLNDAYFPPGTHIRTQEESSAILSFSDMSTFVLKPESEVIIITPPEKESKIKMVAGSIWVNVKKMIKEGSMEIEMNQAVAGIKGTTLVLSDDGKISTLKVIEGEVVFISKFDDKKITVGGGSMVSASNIGLGGVEIFDVVNEIDDWDAVSNNGKKEGGNFNYKIILYGLIGILVIFIIIKVIRRNKK